MTKDELKSLATDMHHNLLSSIDEEDKPTILQMLNHLRETVDVVSKMKDDNAYTLEDTKSTFGNAFKDVATESLSFYENTNTKFEELSNLQISAIEECDQKHVDLPAMVETFTDIQSNMTKEINKANNLISELSSQVKTLEHKSNIDGLTKVFNRRALDTYLAKVCEKNKLAYELHILMLDLDNFKKLNDNYGHIAGDKTLIFISNILRKTLHKNHKAFRYGGEEFLVVLNNVNDKECLKIATNILELIRYSNLIYKGDKLNVTVSIGTTKYKNNDTIESLVDRADKALYEAKEAGKDQLISKRN
jgi:diguanylate cyclase (GGDEF)-like protein